MQTRRSFLIQATLSCGTLMVVMPRLPAATTSPGAVNCARPYGSGSYGAGCYPGGKLRLEPISRNGDDIDEHGYRFRLSSTLPGAVVVEFSDDLEERHFLQKIDATTDGGVETEIADSTAVMPGRRYYRARLAAAG